MSTLGSRADCWPQLVSVHLAKLKREKLVLDWRLKESAKADVR